MSQQNKQTPLPPPNGQALVEYSLILVLVILGFGLALAATGPTIANVFSNTVFNLVSRENEKIPVDGDGTPIRPPDVPDFWETVTAVANYIPVEIPLPTSTPAPLTFTPTPGPPPSATPITPTFTPSKTPTPIPTNTPVDLAVKAPWTDTANVKSVWRLDELDPMGPEDWYGTYYMGTTLTGTIFQEGFNDTLFEGQGKKQVIDFNWGNNSPKVNGPTNDFSVAWTRNIYLSKNMQLTFSIPRADDAVRVWIEGGDYGSSFPACSPTYVSGSWVTNSDANLGYNPVADPSGATIKTDCLIAGNWNGNSSNGPGSFTRTIKAGNYKLHVDYQEKTGSSYVNVGISNNTNLANPDDALLDGAGNPIKVLDPVTNQQVNAAANCDWGNPTALENFADTPAKLWTGYKTGNDSPNFVGSRRCYLEFRGSIEIPDAVTLPNPTLTFWDLWDFQVGTEAWVEVAVYENGNNNRASWVWEKLPLHTGDSFNYNWTYQSILLGPKYSGKLIALRFVLENRDAAKKSRWWVDTIAIDSLPRSTFYTAQTWNLDSKDEAEDFIASGNWGLTTENMMSAGGFAWHESPGTNYTDMNYERAAVPVTNDNNYRIHSLEFNGIIDLSDPRGAPDEDNDNGNQELTFYHSYELANLTGLEVQYAAVTDLATAFGTAPVVWKTFTGSTLVARTGSGATLAIAEQKRLSLKAIADTGVTKFRLRFAMLVEKDSNNDKSGWWIDNIRLERVDAPRYTPYPFEDDMDTNASDKAWVSLGTWGREEGGQAPKPGTGKGSSWTDSPNANYADNDITGLELRNPLDLRADTKNNPRSPACILGVGICNDALHQDKAAVNPLMTFWWKRDLGQTDTLFLEWKLKSESAWRVDPLWVYKDGMVTVGNGNNSRTRTSLAWERVEVDLAPVMTAIGPDNTGSDTEDDIVLRFKFVTNGSSNGPGVWIDNVDLRDRNDQVWKLWPTGQSRKDVANVVIGNGSGLQYVNSGEDLQVFPPEWFIGGNWSAIDFELHDGLTAFHDSAIVDYGTPQTAAEIGNGDTGFVATQGDTFNVLELNTIFDLRATLAVEKPLIYFWHRYAVPSGSTISVQVAEEKPAGTSVTCRDSYTQCYEKMYQWKDWKTIWSVTGDKSNLAWTREQVDLVQFAQNGATAGKRIRIRFVMDALDKNANSVRDGWYIDQVAVMHYPDRRIPISASSSFVDYSTDMTNWVDEGKWGLDPEVFKGGGGIPISIGDYWTVNYWNMTKAMCTAIGGGADTNNKDNFKICVDSFFNPPTTAEPKRAKSSVYKPNTGGIAPTIANRLEIDIFHEWGNSGPESGGTFYTDRFAARFELTTGLVGAPGKAKGLVTFIMASDEGARLKYMNENPGNPATLTTTDACTGKNTTCGNDWNIIEHFSPHGRSITVGSAFLAPVSSLKPDGTQVNNTSGRYRFILEYYDYTGSAVLTLATGSDTFSFSDTPKQGAGPGFTDIPALYRASSSLLLNGVLDLTTAVKPFMTYSTLYELGGTARVEVSVDGGFTWTNAGLRGNVNSKWQDATWNVDMWYNNTLDYVAVGAGPARNHNFTTTNLNYNWGTGTALNGRLDDYSLRFTRKINLTIADELNLHTEADDGVRLWIYKQGDTAPQGNTTGCLTAGAGPYVRSGQATTNGGNTTFTTGCLLIDNWKAQGATGNDTTFKPSTAGVYIIQLDYYEVGGGAQVLLDVSPSSFDLPYYSGTRVDPGNWVIKAHDLSDYQGQRIGLRFRLDRLSETGDDRTTGNGYLNSWWLTEIGVFSN